MKEELLEMALDDMKRWDSRLVELVRNDEIDPWDINIVLLTERYLEFISKIEQLDFRIPGNAVLTASVLLRLKSDHMNWEKRIFAGRSRDEFNWSELPIPDLKPVRRMVERKVTVFELVEALNDAFEVERGRMGRNPLINDLVRINRFEITELMGKMRRYIDANLLDTLVIGDFVAMLPKSEFSQYEAMQYFIALLQLCNDGVIDLEQEAWNAPIMISKSQPILPDQTVEDYGNQEPKADLKVEDGKEAEIADSDEIEAQVDGNVGGNTENLEGELDGNKEEPADFKEEEE